MVGTGDHGLVQLESSTVAVPAHPPHALGSVFGLGPRKQALEPGSTLFGDSFHFQASPTAAAKPQVHDSAGEGQEALSLPDNAMGFWVLCFPLMVRA